MVHIAAASSHLFPGVEAKEVVVPSIPMEVVLRTSSGTSASNRHRVRVTRVAGDPLEDQLGKDGVEKIFEKVLRGTPGSVTLEVDSQGRVLRSSRATDAIPGGDVSWRSTCASRPAEDTLAQSLLLARTAHPRTTRTASLRPQAP